MHIPRKKRKSYRWQANKLATKKGLKVDLESWEQVWNFLDQHGKTSFLYAIVDIKNRLVKFGRSESPATRLKALKTGNGAELRLFAYCDHASPFTEREVHSKLAEHRISGASGSSCARKRGR